MVNTPDPTDHHPPPITTIPTTNNNNHTPCCRRCWTQVRGRCPLLRGSFSCATILRKIKKSGKRAAGQASRSSPPYPEPCHAVSSAGDVHAMSLRRPSRDEVFDRWSYVLGDLQQHLSRADSIKIKRVLRRARTIMSSGISEDEAGQALFRTFYIVRERGVYSTSNLSQTRTPRAA